MKVIVKEMSNGLLGFFRVLENECEGGQWPLCLGSVATQLQKVMAFLSHAHFTCALAILSLDCPPPLNQAKNKYQVFKVNTIIIFNFPMKLYYILTIVSYTNAHFLFLCIYNYITMTQS